MELLARVADKAKIYTKPFILDHRIIESQVGNNL